VKGVPPEVSGSDSYQGQRARDRELLTLEAVGNAVAFLLADLARREHRHREMPFIRPPGEINLRRTGPLTAPPRPANDHPKQVTGGPVECLNRPQEGPGNWLFFAYKIFGAGFHQPGGGQD
jgi:hypothetical protein